jgi:hypothetical protein
MGDKDFVKPLLESRGKVHFGKVRSKTEHAHVCLGPLAHVLSSSAEMRIFLTKCVYLEQGSSHIPSPESRCS